MSRPADDRSEAARAGDAPARAPAPGRRKPAGRREAGGRRSAAGRRPGHSTARDDILAAARKGFAERGFDGVTLRQVAAEAKVDPALIRHYFGDKRGLFAEAIRLPYEAEVLIATVTYGDPETIGERVVRNFLNIWDDPANRVVLVTMIRTVAGHEQSEGMVRDLITNQMVAPIARALDRPDPQLRTTMAGAMLVGLAMQRYVARIDPFASMDPDRIARIVGPTIQRFLTDDLPAE